MTAVEMAKKWGSTAAEETLRRFHREVEAGAKEAPLLQFAVTPIDMQIYTGRNVLGAQDSAPAVQDAGPAAPEAGDAGRA